jgi:hypothetical protein
VRAHPATATCHAPRSQSSRLLLQSCRAGAGSCSHRGRDELARPSSAQDDQHTEELERLQGELNDIDQARHRQSLRMEEHDDPQHPVVALAKERIVELSTRRKAIEGAI